MLGRFLRWWWSELVGMLPGQRAGAGDAAGQWLEVALDGEQQVQARLHGGRSRVLTPSTPLRSGDAVRAELSALASSLDPRRMRCRFRVPVDMGLVKEVELPLAAEENLREVLDFEMSRHTPFHADDVHFDHQVVDRDTARQRLRVRLGVVPRARLAPLTEPFASWHLEPESLRGGSRDDSDPELLTLNFRPAEWRQRSSTALNALLALVLLALVATAVWQPIRDQRTQRAALTEQVRRARAEAADVARLRDALDAVRESRALIAGARGTRAGMVVLLEAVSRALPDGTFLYRFEVKDQEVNLHGSSSAASSLIAILEATPEIEAVRFASPVTRDGATGKERFHIVGRLTDIASDPALAAASER